MSHVNLSDSVCRVWYGAGLLLGLLTIAINDWLVLLRLWVLWDRNSVFMFSTHLIFLATNATVLVLTGVGFRQAIPGLHFEPLLQLCVLETGSRTFQVLRLPGLLFQCVMVFALGWKVLLHPKTLGTLLRDGYLYFLFLFVLNVINTTFVLVSRPTHFFVTVLLMWCSTTTATCRMILSLRSSSPRGRDSREIGLTDCDQSFST
ncbi:hypothetical protein B0H13DRAFT_2661381, partial [Mycena leptocephala]